MIRSACQLCSMAFGAYLLVFAIPATATNEGDLSLACDQNARDAASQSIDCTQIAVASPGDTAQEPRISRQGVATGIDSSLENGQGFIDGSTLNLNFRNYEDRQQVEGVLKRHAWIQTLRADFQSGYTSGDVRFGLSVSPVAALKLDGTEQSGNMGIGDDRSSALLLADYTFNIKTHNVLIKYGLQSVSNPFLEGRDNRALPPSYRGLSIVDNISDSLSLEAGDFSAVLARDATEAEALSTNYGGINFNRLAYAGVNWEYSPHGKISLYLDQASNVWDQAFLSLRNNIGKPESVRWETNAILYCTRNQGDSMQGEIDNKAYSLDVRAIHGASTIFLAYQRILGNQYFDYVGEAAGETLSNTAAEDYNTPHERSLQLHYRINGSSLGAPGLNSDFWVIRGWDSDSSASAVANSSPTSELYPLYWKNGHIEGGPHHEFGVYTTYVVQHGDWKNVKFTALGMAHKSSADYVDGNWQEIRLKLDYPLNIF